MPFTMSGVKEIFRSVMRQFVEQKRPEMVMPMQRDRPMELLQPVKWPDPPSMRQRPLDYLRTFSMLPRHNSSLVKERAGSPAPSCVSMKSDRSMNFPLSFKRYLTIPFTMGGVKENLQYFKRLSEEDERAEEEREDPPAKRREIRAMQLLLLFGVRTSNFFPSGYGFSPEEEEAGCPASSCESMKMINFKDFPLDFNQEDLWHHLWPHEPDPFFFPGFGFSAEEERAGSPALSCGSTMSYDSMDFPMDF